MSVQTENLVVASRRREGLFQRVFRNQSFCWIAFFCSCGVMTLVYYCYHLIPFGDNTILRMDLYHQYGPLFAELYERLVGLKSFLYSWNSGLGNSFLGNFYNYLSSPLSFLIVLFGREHILESISVFVMLKAAIASFTFTYYLKRRQNAHSYATAAFGVLYSFCGFFIAYYWNVMWIDAMALLPLTVLGIEWIIERKKSALYVISLALTFFSNYYMGYMVALFSVLYYLFYFFAHHDLTTENGKFYVYRRNVFGRMGEKLMNSLFLSSGMRFALSSAAVGGLVAFMLLPVYGILQESSATSGTFPQEFTTYFKIMDFLANHLASVDPTIRSSGEDVLPNVYCGMATVILVPLYLFTKSIPVKEKTMHIGLLTVLFFSFKTNYLNYIWHGFHFPNDLPYRFSFVYSFVLLAMAFKAFARLREFSSKEILGAGTAVLFGIVLVEKITSKNVDQMTVFISLAFTVIYVLVFSMLRQKRNQTITMSLMLLCCVVAESAIANTDRYAMDQSKEHFAGDYADFEQMKYLLDLRSPDEFYRMELTDLRAYMDPCWYNYNGVSMFSSMAYEKLANLESRLGMFSNFINSYVYNRQTPIYNMMHSLKYIVDNNLNSTPNMNKELYKICGGTGKFKPYENLYNLPVAYCVDADIINWNSINYDPFEVQRSYFEHATGIPNALEWITSEGSEFDNVYEIDYGYDLGEFSFEKITPGNTGTVTLELKPKTSQNLYIYVSSNDLDSLTAIGSGYHMTHLLDRKFIVDLGYCEAGDSISVDLKLKDTVDSGAFTFLAYGLNMDSFKTGYEQLKSEAMQIESFDERHFNGTVKAREDCVLYTSIPADQGWTVKIDGEAVNEEDYIRIADALLGVRIKAGEHQVEISYMPRYQVIGAAISLFFALLLLAYLILAHRLERSRRKRQKQLEEQAVIESYEFVVAELPDEELYEKEAPPEEDAPGEINPTGETDSES